MTVSFHDLVNALSDLELDRSRPVIAHASLSAFGSVQGGAETVLGALRSIADTLIMPTFTYKTMVTPESGPENNGLVYGSMRDANRMAEFFHPEMPADPLMGIIAETLRRQPEARRSSHPILSFAGINAEEILQTQTLDNPLAPIHELTAQGGWVLLLGVNHTVNTSIHYAEKFGGRKQFLRWALTRQGVRECPGFPGCSNGFEAITSRLRGIERRTQIGYALVRAIPLSEMVDLIQKWLIDDPLALLCPRRDCRRCNAVRQAVGRE
jgi:aminoglycoside 3-N-acetyltransferase